MSGLVASDPTVFDSIRFSGKTLTTPCLSDEEWAYLLQTGQEREEDAGNLEQFRCLVAEYQTLPANPGFADDPDKRVIALNEAAASCGGIKQIGAELKHYLANPGFADDPDKRVIALNEAAASCGIET